MSFSESAHEAGTPYGTYAIKVAKRLRKPSEGLCLNILNDFVETLNIKKTY